MAAETLEDERAWFDRAHSHRERLREGLQAAPEAALDPRAGARIKKAMAGPLDSLGDPDEPVAIGRFDDEDGEVLYIGKHAILDDQKDVLVVNWQQPVAERFYRATAADPMALLRKRTYNCDGSRLISFDELVFADLAARLEHALGEEEQPEDALLRDLERSRTGEMRDIVQTIQASQDEVIRADIDGLLIVQGGPGTGKTAVALHRVSWLLYTHANEIDPQDVLVIGPSPVFTRYIKQVLPSLGDNDVRQLSIGELGPHRAKGRIEDPEAARLKGDARMSVLLRRAARQRVRMPGGDSALAIAVGGMTIRFSADEIEAQCETLYNTNGYARGRLAFRDWLSGRITTEASQRRTRGAASQTDVENFVERIWPQLSPAMLLQELLGSRDRLLTAAGSNFSALEVQALYRQSAGRVADEVWSAADVALLDECEAVLGSGAGVETFKHIVVDEAQDLSPMQLRSLLRRSSNRSVTLVGDIAQSTSEWARDSWNDIEEALGLPTRMAELEIGYRVPREVFELAAQLLPRIAPELTAPRVIRSAGTSPVITACDDEDQAVQAVLQARTWASKGCSVGLICPDTHRNELEAVLRRQDIAWDDGGKGLLGKAISVIRPAESKGLEFDAVVVIEPEAIVEESTHGLRMLYVALTRSTKHLAIVHHGDPIVTTGATTSADAADDERPRDHPSIPPTHVAAEWSEAELGGGDSLPAEEPSAAADTDEAVQTPAEAPEAAVQDTERQPRTSRKDSARGPKSAAGREGRTNDRLLRVVAQDLAQQIADSVPESRWDDLLEALIDELQQGD